jgi:hypothetical protein
VKKSEAPPFPTSQSLQPVVGTDHFYMHPEKICWVVAPTPVLRVFYHLPTFRPLRFATVDATGSETEHEFQPEDSTAPAAIEAPALVEKRELAAVGPDYLALQEFVRWVAWGSKTSTGPLAEELVVSRARELIPRA